MKEKSFKPTFCTFSSKGTNEMLSADNSGTKLKKGIVISLKEKSFKPTFCTFSSKGTNEMLFADNSGTKLKKGMIINMYNTLMQAALEVMQSKSTDEIGDEIIRKLGGEMGSIGDFVVQIINVVVVPFILMVLLIVMLFLITSMAIDHHKQNNEGFEVKVKYALACLVVFIFLGGYGLFVGDLMKFVTG